MLNRRCVIFLLLIVLASSCVARARAAAPQPQFFKETGHVLADPMHTYWTTHGGLPVFGYPIWEAFDERRNDARQAF